MYITNMQEFVIVYVSKVSKRGIALRKANATRPCRYENSRATLDHMEVAEVTFPPLPQPKLVLYLI